jgi:hypothetical protein
MLVNFIYFYYKISIIDKLTNRFQKIKIIYLFTYDDVKILIIFFKLYYKINKILFILTLIIIII